MNRLLQFCLAALVAAGLQTAHAQGTAFTYQGRLDIAGVPANGSNDLTFTLYDAVTAGATVGTSNTVNDLVITGGLFTVTLDFGAGAFNGAARWLQIAARPGTSTGGYTNLAPRQPITPSPYAIFAGGASAAGVTGTLPAAALTGVSGSGLTSLNASNLTSGTVADARLSTNVALRNGGNTFNGNQFFTNGNVGIGTSSPLAPLHVNGGIAARSTSLTKGYVTMQPGDVGYAGYLEIFGTNAVRRGFLGYNSGVNLGLENGSSFNITGGNVGIGTTTPNFPMSFADSGGEKISLYGQDTNSIHGIGIGGQRLEFYVPSTAHNFVFGVGNNANFSEKMRISGNGNVGIGIAGPVAQLDVRGPSTIVGGIALGDYNLTNSRYIGIINPGQPANIAAGSGFSGLEFGGPAGNPNSGLIAFHTHNLGGGSAERMRIDKLGNVGIGTATPDSLLTLGGNVTQKGMSIVTSAGDPFIRFEDYNGGSFASKADIYWSRANNVLAFNSGGQKSSFGGNVGLGTATPNFPLSFANTGGEKISLYGQDTNSIHGIGIGGARMEFYVPSSGHNFAFGVGNNANFSEAMHISGNGDVVASGEVTCTAVNITSDRNAKEQFKPVNAREVLAKVVGLPISEWQYKTQADARHIGPMAQDFREAFTLGHDEKHISTVDEGGVALAAIQGLNEKLEEKSAEVDALKQSVAELKELVKRLTQPAGR